MLLLQLRGPLPAGDKPMGVIPIFHFAGTNIGPNVSYAPSWGFSFEPCTSPSPPVVFTHLIHNKTYTLSFKEAYILFANDPNPMPAVPYIMTNYLHGENFLLPAATYSGGVFPVGITWLSFCRRRDGDGLRVRHLRLAYKSYNSVLNFLN